MSAPVLTSADLTVGQVGRNTVSFRAPHSDVNRTPVTTSVVLTVPMSHEDIEAVFWRLLRDGGVTFAELAEDSGACWYLLDSIIGEGVSTIESYRLALAEVTAADPEDAAVGWVRRRVEELFGPHPCRRRAAGRRAERSRGGNRAPLLISHSHSTQAGTPALEGGRV